MHLPSLSYDCVSCGKSCTDFQVEIDSKDVPRLERSEVTQALKKQGYTPLQIRDDRVFLEKIEGGTCRYLSEQVLCRLHTEGGFGHKPRTCQTFPFAPVATPDGVYVGVSFYCTAVAQSQGRMLKGRQDELAFLLESPECQSVAPDSQWGLWESQAVDWANYLQIEQFLRAGIEKGPRLGLLQAVWRLGAAVSTGDLGFLNKPLDNCKVKTDALQLLVRRFIPIMESSDINSFELAEALKNDGKFHSVAAGHGLILEPPPLEYPAWLNEALSRYLHHVLFRKGLLRAPNVLSRACLLAVAGELIAIYAYGRSKHEEREIRAEDFYGAVGLVEGRLMLHAKGLEVAVQRCADDFLQLNWDDWM